MKSHAAFAFLPVALSLGVACAPTPLAPSKVAPPPAPSAPPSTVASATPVPAAPVLDRELLRAFTESRRFRRGSPQSVTLTPDGSTVLFLRSGPRDTKQSLFEMDVASGTERELLTAEALDKGPEHLTLEERARRERMRITATGFTGFELSKDGKTVVVSLSGKLYALDRASGKTRQIDTGKGSAIDPRLSPDGKSLAYAALDDVYVIRIDGDGSAKPRAVTRGGTESKPHGLTDFVAAEELDRQRGFWWSPDSKSIVYEEADASGVEHFTIADPAHPESPADRVAYPRPGKANAVLRLGVVRVAAPGATTWIDWDHAQMPYVWSVSWQEGAPLSVVVLDRLQKNESMLVADPATGKTHEAMRERDDAWINVGRLGMPRWLPDGSAFLWWSERDGDARIGLVSAKDTTKVTWLTPKGVQVISLLDVDPSKRVAIVETTRDGLHEEVSRVSFDGGDLATVAKLDDGVVSGTFGEGHDAFVAREASLSSPPRAVVRSLDGKTAREIASHALAPPLPHVEIEEVGPEKIRVALVRPRGYVPGARYPLIDAAYAGPHVQMVDLNARGMILEQWMADATGAIVVAIDAKGTPGRGRDWERALLAKLADVPLSGHVEAIHALAAAHPEIDESRVGVYGWSFGGYFSALAALRRPDVYAVAVAIAPVTEWRDYDTGYTERYLGLPEANAAAYDAASLLVAAREKPPLRQAKLVVAHGTADDNVYFFHSLKLVDALAKAGREFSFLPFNGQTHQMASPEAERAVWEHAAEALREGLSSARAR